MIWNYIRDFLVQNIFGGYTSEGDYFACSMGKGYFTGGYDNDLTTADNFIYKIGYDPMEDSPIYMNVGDWLSTTFTIIIMCMIVVFAIWIVRWVYKTVTSAFLLK